MEEFKKDTSGRKKLILAFVIINFFVIMGFAVVSFLFVIAPKESSDVGLVIVYLPLFFGSVLCVILALVELTFGIFTYKGKNWAAIALICCMVITLIGVFVMVAGILQLTAPSGSVK